VNSEIRACAAGGNGFGLHGFIADRALRRGGVGHKYRGGRGEDESEAIIKLDLDVPFIEAFGGPFHHVLCLKVLRVFAFGKQK
jgi:hypothetical protein